MAEKPRDYTGQIISSYTKTLPKGELREKVKMLKDSPASPTNNWSAINKPEGPSNPKFSTAAELVPHHQIAPPLPVNPEKV